MGSEMCIRDSARTPPRGRLPAARDRPGGRCSRRTGPRRCSVSRPCLYRMRVRMRRTPPPLNLWTAEKIWTKMWINGLCGGRVAAGIRRRAAVADDIRAEPRSRDGLPSPQVEGVVPRILAIVQRDPPRRASTVKMARKNVDKTRCGGIVDRSGTWKVRCRRRNAVRGLGGLSLIHI